MSHVVLSAKGVSKRFGGVHALRGVDFDLRDGEIHALLGENGAGKSTLMNLLSGVHTADEGEIFVDGKLARFHNPRDAQAAGIATIFQELDLVPSLSVAANLFLGRELVHPYGMLDGKAMLREARVRLEAIDRSIDPAQLVSELSIGQRQVVAIVKALSYASRVLIMDEPTAALTVGEVDRLFGIMRKLASSGVGIVYISHRLEEVPLIAHRVTVMRDGKVAGVTAPDAPQAELVQLLVGRPLMELYPRRADRVGDVLLRMRQASFRPFRSSPGWQAPVEINLDVRRGEIVGLAGVMGAGRTELLSALYGTGVPGKWHGEISISGRPAKLKSIAAARRSGL
ncbi:MAG: sugar ABC transporter ATP-binding protein, partial [Rhizobiaceae bacterium]|nr:sugar ABC transporter ATP-binding protein [Rhizobiaceae bacterium]